MTTQITLTDETVTVDGVYYDKRGTEVPASPVIEPSPPKTPEPQTGSFVGSQTRSDGSLLSVGEPGTTTVVNGSPVVELTNAHSTPGETAFVTSSSAPVSEATPVVVVPDSANPADTPSVESVVVPGAVNPTSAVPSSPSNLGLVPTGDAQETPGIPVPDSSPNQSVVVAAVPDEGGAVAPSTDSPEFVAGESAQKTEDEAAENTEDEQEAAVRAVNANSPSEVANAEADVPANVVPVESGVVSA